MPLPGRRTRCAFSSRRCRTKHLPLLGFEEPPCVQSELPQLDPLPLVAAALRNALLVMAVHGVNACLKPLMLGAQADEGRLLQAAGVEIHGLVAFRRPHPWAHSRHEVRRLPLCTTAGLKANATNDRGKSRQAGGDRGEQRLPETRGPGAKP